jgi:hypothetical protein
MSEPRAPDRRWNTIFALDVRSLAALRMAFGGLVLIDLAARARDFSAMYTETGIAPVELVRSQTGPGSWSFHLLSGATWVQAGLFAVAAVFAAALVVGYRTRLATIASFVMLASLHGRVPLVLNAGDTMLRVLLFWSIFLPLGAVWSLDARRRSPPPARSVSSLATFAFMVQLALVYWCAGLSKLNPVWLSGDALGNIYSFTLYGQPLGHLLAQFPEVTRWMTLATVAFEIAGPLIIFMPFCVDKCRTAAVIIFIGFHLGIAATITVGLFPWVGAAAWIALIPGSVWGQRGLSDRNAATSPSVAQHDQAFKLGAASNAIALAALAFVLIGCTLDLIGRGAAPRIAAIMRPLGNLTMLRQSWRLFSKPTKFDAWFHYSARLASGDVVDLATGAPFTTFEEATATPQQFANHRWRKLHLRLTQNSTAPYRTAAAEYMRRQWDEQHGPDERVARLDFTCTRVPVDRDGNQGAFVRLNLAVVGDAAEQGAFAEALRDAGSGIP